MPGTESGPTTNDPTIVSAFHTALLHQGLVIVLIIGALIVGWNLLRVPYLHRGEEAAPNGDPESATLAPEPDARKFLRIGFGLLWIFDGILQAQAAMPLGMVPQVILPSADGSPSWVQHLVNTMATTWSYHPITAAAAAVWVQVGIGVWLLVAPRGTASRFAGIASIGWGLVVWVFGEAFGGIFAPGLTWLFGAPGAVLIYCIAGLLMALPERHWYTPRLGRGILGLFGLFFVGMGLLQAWPGRGFWQGRVGHSLGSLPSIVDDMAHTSQPHFLSSWVASFEAFDTAHGWAVNFFVVIALAAVGVAFLVPRRDVLRWAVVAATVLCLADWVLIEDLGIFGGVGTDPNSMVPMMLLIIGGYLALSRVPATRDARSAVPATAAIRSAVAATVSGTPVYPWGAPRRRPGITGLGVWAAGMAAAWAGALWRALGRWRRQLVSDSSYAFRSLAGLAAIGVTFIGAAPMAAATTSPNAESILAKAVNGPPETTNMATPPFSLIDQRGARVSLTSLRGKAVALIFLDPACTKQMEGSCAAVDELRLTDRVLGTQAKGVELVAINSNPRYANPADMATFDDYFGLDKMRNWLYLTGRRSELTRVLNDFGVHVAPRGGGQRGYSAMGLPHGQSAYVIDGSGRTREVLSIGDRGAVSKVMESSVAVALANAIEQVKG
ncbi:MAG: SCO family protein [Acidimicrobiaceae bacterium]|nr:SCO family protein [Acidimicrobiaceae bacterium]